MTDEPLPKQADLRKLAGRYAHFHVSSDLAAFKRFAGVVVNGVGKVEAQLQFDVNDHRVPCIDGWVRCETQVVCQRCMEPVSIEFQSEISLTMVKNDEQAQNLPKTREPLLVDDDELFDLNEMLEEELLLALPFVSFHEPDQCKGRKNYESSTTGEDLPVVEKKENPFSVLEALKSSK